MSWYPDRTDPTRCIDQYRLSSSAPASLPWGILESLGPTSGSERHWSTREILAVQSSFSDIGSRCHVASILLLLSSSHPYSRTITISTRFEWNLFDKRSRFKAHHCIAHENGHFETIECSSVMYSLDFVYFLFSRLSNLNISYTICKFVHHLNLTLLNFSLFSSHSFVGSFARITLLHTSWHIFSLITVQSEHVQSNTQLLDLPLECVAKRKRKGIK